MSDDRPKYAVAIAVPACPFCGKTQFGTVRNEDNRHVAVLCKSCGATGPRITYDSLGTSNIEDVVVAWSRRAADGEVSPAVDVMCVVNPFGPLGFRQSWIDRMQPGWRDAVTNAWRNSPYRGAWQQWILRIGIGNESPGVHLTEFRFLETPRRGGIKVSLL